MHRKWQKFGAVAGLYYLIQFVMCVGICNFYGDVSRYYICQREDLSYIRGEDASAVYDLALYMTGIFHVVEWIRATILLVVIFIGVNLMHVWYASALASFYGFVCLVIVHIAVASEDGKACASQQETRYTWLVVEVVYFWALFFPAQVFPAMITCWRKHKLEETLNKEDDDSDDE